jgi:hypothetical protein
MRPTTGTRNPAPDRLGDKSSEAPREDKMKHVLLGVLLGLAIGFAVPAFAQQKDTPDPQLRQQFEANDKKLDEAWNNNDAAAVAALFTENAVLVTPKGPIYGREAIEKYYAGLFQKEHFSGHLTYTVATGQSQGSRPPRET